MSDRTQELEPSRLDQSAHVYIIILNWNGWRDTIECLDSVFRLGYPNFTVVVCDNASEDGSVEQIRRWARGEICASSANSLLARLITPAVKKPIPLLEYPSPQESLDHPDLEAPLVLIQTGNNLGFAGGNNVGLRYAMACGNCDYAWLLNNDTVVDPDALVYMVEHMKQNPEIGICGSVLRCYYSPESVQAYGGRLYGHWTGRVHPLRNSIGPKSQPIDYVYGASMLVSREFLQRVGLLDEGYFLYFEELDWAARARDQFTLGYSPKSIVFHKEGASIGTNPDRKKRSILQDKYTSRNRVRFTRKFYPALLPFVLVCVGISALHRIMTGDFRRGMQMLSAAVEGLKS